VNRPDSLDGYRRIDSQHNARTDEDLTRLGFVAKSGRDIGDRPNRRIIVAAFEANRAERRKSVRYANTKAKVVTEQTPFLDHCSNGGSHIKRPQNGLERRGFHRGRIVEDHHHAAATKSSVPLYLTMIPPIAA